MRTVITAAITGSWPTREQNPNLSITPEEIAKDVYECWKAGAAIAHIHVRNDDGTPSTDFEKYKETIERIRAYKDCDICINITSSGSVGFGDEERIYPLQKLLPEMASYDAGTLNWQHRTIFENHPRFLEKLGTALIESNIKPEIEIFDAGMIPNTALRDFAKEVAEELKLPTQISISEGGATDGGRIHLHDAGVLTLTFSIPTRYIHSHQSIIHMDDYQGAVQLITAMIEKLDKKKYQQLLKG